jgi:DNA mismatch endonuclease (patch repair protein)
VEAVRRQADVVFRRVRVAVFVDGCFWHGCSTHGSRPRANANWWLEKLRCTRARDADTDRTFKQHGWLVVRCWEHDVRRDASRLAVRIERLVRTRRTTVRA